MYNEKTNNQIFIDWKLGSLSGQFVAAKMQEHINICTPNGIRDTS